MAKNSWPYFGKQAVSKSFHQKSANFCAGTDKEIFWALWVTLGLSWNFPNMPL